MGGGLRVLTTIMGASVLADVIASGKMLTTFTSKDFLVWLSLRVLVAVLSYWWITRARRTISAAARKAIADKARQDAFDEIYDIALHAKQDAYDEIYAATR